MFAIPTGAGATADADGTWTIDAAGADSLRFSYVGYESLTLAVTSFGESPKDIVLQPRSLDVVTVTTRQQGNFTSTLDPRNVESITSTELKKAPCCNLGESFETNAAVDVSYRDAATGAREMQVLGLQGIYSQLLIEKRPTLYGLATPIALDLIAGTWLDGIQIGKGASSVQTGPNALSGQVNTELVKPIDTEPLYVNLFASGFGRTETNVHLARQWTDQHSTGLLLHASNNPQSHDRDNDGFAEQPFRRTLSGIARHFYQTEDWRAQLNVWGASDRREGGQGKHAEGGDHGAHHGGGAYVLQQANDRVEAFAKTGYLGFSRAATSIGFIASATYHQLDNQYGASLHNASQRSGYGSILFSSYIGTTNHLYTVGASVRRDEYDETLLQPAVARTNYDRDESSTGVFGEYTFDLPAGSGDLVHSASLIAGMRVDHHSVGGWQALPRLNLKVNPREGTSIRASAGRAYRSPQVIAENIRLLASNRAFDLSGELGLTTGWNYGVALAHTFELPAIEAAGFTPSGQLTVDAYTTQFGAIAVVDQDATALNTVVAQSDAPASTTALLASLRIEPIRGLEVKVAGKYVDARQTYLDGVERSVPYIAKWRGLASVDYELPSERWRVNTNLQWVGPQRLPGADVLPLFDFDIEEPLLFESPSFALLSAQLTYVANDRLELYAGGENLTDYRQTRAILGARNADAQYFDASRVYAPLMGAMPYAGLRFTLAN